MTWRRTREWIGWLVLILGGSELRLQETLHRPLRRTKADRSHDDRKLFVFVFHRVLLKWNSKFQVMRDVSLKHLKNVKGENLITKVRGCWMEGVEAVGVDSGFLRRSKIGKTTPCCSNSAKPRRCWMSSNRSPDPISRFVSLLVCLVLVRFVDLVRDSKHTKTDHPYHAHPQAAERGRERPTPFPPGPLLFPIPPC